MDLPNSVFSTFSFIGFVLISIPLYWHLEAWNTGTCLYMGWTSINSLNLFINSVVWNNDAINRAPVWCDISTRIFLGASVGIPAASLCINRRLYQISRIQAVHVTKSEKRRAVMVDLAIGLGIPLLQIILAYIVQGHRFDLFEEIGCMPSIYNTPVSYPLARVWPLAISVVSAFYCTMTIRAFVQRTAEFNEFLGSNKNLTVSRYFRLMALAGVELLFGIPLSSYSIYLNVASGIVPWISWADTHFDFSRVDLFPSVVWRQSKVVVISLELSRWSTVACAFIFFAFFGFADEAKKRYRLVFWSLAKLVGYRPTPATNTVTARPGYRPPYNRNKPLPSIHDTTGTIPVFINMQRTQRRDSDLSFFDKDEEVINGDFEAVTLDEVLKTKSITPPESTLGSSTATLTAPNPLDTPQPSEVHPQPHPSEALYLAWPDFITTSPVPQHDADAPMSVSGRPSPHLGPIDIV